MRNRLLVFGANCFKAKNISCTKAFTRHQCDLLNQKEFTNLLLDEKPCHIINCAARRGSINSMAVDHVDHVEVNFQ